MDLHSIYFHAVLVFVLFFVTAYVVGCLNYSRNNLKSNSVKADSERVASGCSVLKG